MSDLTILDRIRTLPVPQWMPAPPATPGQIEAVEQALGLALPDDYRQFLLFSGGGELRGTYTGIVFEPIDLLVQHNRDPQFLEKLPGMVVFANDGGGSAYYFDPDDQLGQGRYAIYLVPFGVLTFPFSRFVGANLTELITRILDGEDLFDLPLLGHQP